MTFGSAGPGKHKDSGAVESQQHPQWKGKGKGKTSNRKEAAVWTVEEEAALLDFLYRNRMGTDGVTFNKKVYLAAAASLAQQYTDQKGGKKTYAACKTKFSSLKSSYNAAVDLRFGGSLLGFMWTDDGGACIDDSSASAWAGYVKSHCNAKQFWNPLFPHFDIFNLLTAGNATKGIHVHQIQRNKVASISSTTDGINLRELSVATNEISAGMASSSAPLSHSIAPTSPTATMGPPASPNAMGAHFGHQYIQAG
ncbi:hypothetical protein EV702DRAFT_1045520 [Suillus placidus]|uniref:Myb/SANT-like domain-containing protein n=1 Tax=Suillus placidus TaxID=48579 RepID=A0A9P7D3H9_9AGAM|nr:hypothetical protein EV702DRAFT_1045520 [Suillus placidus]